MKVYVNEYNKIKIAKNDGSVITVNNWQEVEDTYKSILFLNESEDDNNGELM